jgi:8-oxo-dGTP diphosphatase
MDQKRSRSGTWQATNSAGYPAPAAFAVDVVALSVRDGELVALVVQRPDGWFGLPGGFVSPEEDPAETAARKLCEKTGLDRVYVEQLATFGRPGRDPRGWIPTVAHLALVPPDTAPSDPFARWVAVADHPTLAFDHDAILAAALERVRGKLWWSNVAVGILPGAFTLADARSVYEAIAAAAYDPATFARDLRATGLIEPTGDERRETGGRPAALYRFARQDPAWGAGRRKRIGREPDGTVY